MVRLLTDNQKNKACLFENKGTSKSNLSLTYILIKFSYFKDKYSSIDQHQSRYTERFMVYLTVKYQILFHTQLLLRQW